VYDEAFYPALGTLDGHTDVQSGSNNAAQGDQGVDNETQDGHDPVEEQDVSNRWEFSDSELADLAALDRTFDEFYWRRGE